MVSAYVALEISNCIFNLKDLFSSERIDWQKNVTDKEVLKM